MLSSFHFKVLLERSAVDKFYKKKKQLTKHGHSHVCLFFQTNMAATVVVAAMFE